MPYGERFSLFLSPCAKRKSRSFENSNLSSDRQECCQVCHQKWKLYHFCKQRKTATETFIYQLHNERPHKTPPDLTFWKEKERQSVALRRIHKVAIAIIGTGIISSMEVSNFDLSWRFADFLQATEFSVPNHKCTCIMGSNIFHPSHHHPLSPPSPSYLLKLNDDLLKPPNWLTIRR